MTETLSSLSPSWPPSRRVSIILGVLALVIIVLAALAFVKIDGIALYDRAMTAFVLRDVRVADRSYDAITVNRFGIRGLVPVTLSGEVGDYAKHGRTEVAVVRGSDTRAQELMLLGRAPRALTASGSAKASLALSPDGALVAYAARTDGNANGAPELSAWSLHVLDISSGTDADLGPGFGPQFFERDGATWLLFTTPAGITVTKVEDVDALSSFTTPFEVVDSTTYAARVSPDGKYLAFRDAATRQFSLYAIHSATQDLPLAIEPLPGNLTGLFDVVFAGGRVYGIDSADGGIAGGVAVLKVDPGSSEEGKPVYLFAAAHEYRLIP